MDKFVFVAAMPKSGGMFVTWLLQGDDVWVTPQLDFVRGTAELFKAGFELAYGCSTAHHELSVYNMDTHHARRLPYCNFLLLPFHVPTCAIVYTFVNSLRQCFGNPEWFGDMSCDYMWAWRDVLMPMMGGAALLKRCCEIRFIITRRKPEDAIEALAEAYKKAGFGDRSEPMAHHRVTQSVKYMEELLQYYAKDPMPPAIVDFEQLQGDWHGVADYLRDYLSLPRRAYPEPPEWTIGGGP